MKLVCLSDTHLRHGFPVPDGDILLHAGDFTLRGNEVEIRQFLNWFSGLPHKHKIFIAGNHEIDFETKPLYTRALIPPSLTYLQDSFVEVLGLKIHGSPWQPWFMNWAFNLARGGEALAEKWAMIPEDTDILITHSPPFGYGDMTLRGERVGCQDLINRVLTIKPLVHVFGHVHPGYGLIEDKGVQFLNACICNEDYRPVNPALVIEV